MISNRPKNNYMKWIWFIMLIFVIGFFGLVFFLKMYNPQKETIATIEERKGAIFINESQLSTFALSNKIPNHSTLKTSSGFIKLTLEDGAELEMDPRTELKIDYRPDQRRIELLSGRCWFRVKTDPKRPFLVLTSFCSIETIGTYFEVNTGIGGTTVYVAEGKIRIVNANLDKILKAGESFFVNKKFSKTPDKTDSGQSGVTIHGDANKVNELRRTKDPNSQFEKKPANLSIFKYLHENTLILSYLRQPEFYVDEMSVMARDFMKGIRLGKKFKKWKQSASLADLSMWTPDNLDEETLPQWKSWEEILAIFASADELMYGFMPDEEAFSVRTYLVMKTQDPDGLTAQFIKQLEESEIPFKKKKNKIVFNTYFQWIQKKEFILMSDDETMQTLDFSSQKERPFYNYIQSALGESQESPHIWSFFFHGEVAAKIDPDGELTPLNQHFIRSSVKDEEQFDLVFRFSEFKKNQFIHLPDSMSAYNCFSDKTYLLINGLVDPIVLTQHMRSNDLEFYPNLDFLYPVLKNEHTKTILGKESALGLEPPVLDMKENAKLVLELIEPQEFIAQVFEQADIYPNFKIEQKETETGIYWNWSRDSQKGTFTILHNYLVICNTEDVIKETILNFSQNNTLENHDDFYRLMSSHAYSYYSAYAYLNLETVLKDLESNPMMLPVLAVADNIGGIQLLAGLRKEVNPDNPNDIWYHAFSSIDNDFMETNDLWLKLMGMGMGYNDIEFLMQAFDFSWMFKLKSVELSALYDTGYDYFNNKQVLTKNGTIKNLLIGKGMYIHKLWYYPQTQIAYYQIFDRFKSRIFEYHLKDKKIIPIDIEKVEVNKNVHENDLQIPSANGQTVCSRSIEYLTDATSGMTNQGGIYLNIRQRSNDTFALKHNLYFETLTDLNLSNDGKSIFAVGRYLTEDSTGLYIINELNEKHPMVRQIATGTPDHLTLTADGRYLNFIFKKELMIEGVQYSAIQKQGLDTEGKFEYQICSYDLETRQVLVTTPDFLKEVNSFQGVTPLTKDAVLFTVGNKVIRYNILTGQWKVEIEYTADEKEIDWEYGGTGPSHLRDKMYQMIPEQKR